MSEGSHNHDGLNAIIRIASASDARMLACLRYDFRSSVGAVEENEKVFVDRCSVWMVKRLQEHSPWKCWLAEQDRTAVGNLWSQLIEKIPNPTSEPEYHLYFSNFFVRENCRGKGIGSKLFAAALTWSRSKDVHSVILWPTERSHPFYERHGFSVTSNVMELEIR